MKPTSKILTITLSALIVLAFTSQVNATYSAYTAITAPDINDTVYAGQEYTLTCVPSTDTDCNDSTGECQTVDDPITHTWSGLGTWTDSSGPEATWIAPAVAGDVNITVTADDSPLYDETAKTDTVTLTVVYDRAFSLLDGSDNNIAIFDNVGNLFLKGTMDESTAHTATAVDEFIFEDSSNSELAIIDANDGNMYIDGQVFQSQDTLTPSGTNHFIIEDSDGNTVAYIDDPNGDLYLKGALYEQVF